MIHQAAITPKGRGPAVVTVIRPDPRTGKRVSLTAAQLASAAWSAALEPTGPYLSGWLSDSMFGDDE